MQINATDIQVNAANTLISSDGQTTLMSGGATNISGAVIRLNGPGCPPVARVGDHVHFGELGVIVSGSPTELGHLERGHKHWTELPMTQPRRPSGWPRRGPCR